MQQDKQDTQVAVLTIFEILRERKVFIFFASLVGLAAALIFSFIVPPTYETSANIDVGKVWGLILEAPQEICETILSEAFLMKVIEMNKLMKTPGELKRKIEVEPTKDVQKRVLGIIKLSVKGNTPEECVQLITSIISLIQKDHAQMFDEWMAINFQYQKELETKITKLKEEIAELQTIQMSRLKNPGKSANPILHLEGYIEERETSYLDLLEEFHKANSNNHSRFYSRKTAIRYPPPKPVKPVAPKITLNAMGGLLVGFFCALAWAAYKKYVI
ncbi:MAG: hypothetical protein A2161_06495 [Candidatus Schekmanbacteria bacterium RBG_13_48_7]|uniref:Polysaccharide chain length determinant N-terminal domain-containing protein n=1 Tax=Candidatus Schekmanbacteria bacterium RBG_13_48_7 TaxID=1817878 RepID=A0A1F7S9T8_9BACT|nr:MAG: hypothetical protein A2161_06495 [Candidatus Schekmanbacteria bacterium RBG_13_48_7]